MNPPSYWVRRAGLRAPRRGAGLAALRARRCADRALSSPRRIAAPHVAWTYRWPGASCSWLELLRACST